MSTLIVTLPWPAAPATGEIDYVLSPDGRMPGTHGQAAPALLPQPGGAGSEVVAVVPAQALAWHRLELPKGTTPTSPRLRAILEGMLEDRLLDEPEAVHFAVQPGAVPGNPIWVAVCDRAWLRAAVQTLESAQRPATRIVPEFSPGEPVTATLTGDPERAVLVLASAGGVMAWPVHGGTAAPARGLDGAGRAGCCGSGGTTASPQGAVAAGHDTPVAGGPVGLGPCPA